MSLMMLAKNPTVKEVINGSPKQIYTNLKGKVDQFFAYQPEHFEAQLNQYDLSITPREQRYIRNVAKTRADLLIFMNKYCDGTQDNLNLDAETVRIVCKVGKQALTGEAQ